MLQAVRNCTSHLPVRLFSTKGRLNKDRYDAWLRPSLSNVRALLSNQKVQEALQGPLTSAMADTSQKVRILEQAGAIPKKLCTVYNLFGTELIRPFYGDVQLLDTETGVFFPQAVFDPLSPLDEVSLDSVASTLLDPLPLFQTREKWYNRKSTENTFPIQWPREKFFAEGKIYAIAYQHIPSLSAPEQADYMSQMSDAAIADLACTVLSFIGTTHCLRATFSIQPGEKTDSIIINDYNRSLGTVLVTKSNNPLIVADFAIKEALREADSFNFPPLYQQILSLAQMHIKMS